MKITYRIRHILTISLLVLGAMILTSCVQETIRNGETEVLVRVVNPDTGEPISGMDIVIGGFHRLYPLVSDSDRIIRDTTDQHGELKVSFDALSNILYSATSYGKRINSSGEEETYLGCVSEFAIEPGEVQTIEFERIPMAFYELRIQADSTLGPVDSYNLSFTTEWGCEEVHPKPINLLGMQSFERGIGNIREALPSGKVKMIQLITRGGEVERIEETLDIRPGETRLIEIRY
ncbi:MAG: hypothetical protein AAFY71_00030 [Bacteroidota bacterium]